MTFNLKKALLAGTAIVAVGAFAATTASAQTAVTANTTFDDGTAGTNVSTLTTTDTPIITINNAEVIVDADITATGANNGVVGFVTGATSVLTVNAGSTITSTGTGDTVTTANLANIDVNIAGAVTASANTEDALNFGALAGANQVDIVITGGAGTNGNVTGVITGGAGADTLTINTAGGDSTLDGAINLAAGADVVTISGTGAVTTTGAVNLGAATDTVNFTGDATLNIAGAVNGAITTATTDTGTLATAAAGATSVSGNVGTTGNKLKAITNTGAGTLTLDGTADATTLTNSGTGEIEIDGAFVGTTVNATAGTIDFDDAATATNFNISDGATITANGGAVTGAVTNAGILSLEAGSSVVGDVANSGEIDFVAASTITGNVSGAGTLDVDAASTIDGNVAATSADVADGIVLTIDGDDAGAATAGTASIGTVTFGNATSGLTLISDVDGTTTFTGNTAGDNGDGIVTFGDNAAEAQNYVFNGNMGSADDMRINDISVGGANGAAVVATINGNVWADDIAVGTGDTLNLTGTTVNVDVLGGDTASTIVIGNGTSATTATFDVASGGANAVAMTVSDNATLNAQNDYRVDTLLVNGTLTTSGANTPTITADTAFNVGFDGSATLNIDAPTTLATSGITFGDDAGDTITVRAGSNADLDLDGAAAAITGGGVAPTFTAGTVTTFGLGTITAGNEIETGDVVTWLTAAGGANFDTEVTDGRIAFDNGLVTFDYDESQNGIIRATVGYAAAESAFGGESTGTGVADFLVNLTGANATAAGLATVRDGLIGAGSAAQQKAFAESLAPEANGAVALSANESSNLTTNVVSDRIDLAMNGGTDTGMVAGEMGSGHVWAKAFGQLANQDTRDGVAGFDADTYGLAVGIDSDAIIDGAVVGVSLSYADTDVDSDGANSTDTEIDSYQLSVYGGTMLQNDIYMNAMVGYAWNDVDQTRNNVAGVAGNNANADFDSDQWTVYTEFGKDYMHGDMVLTPHVLANFQHLSIDNYTETGSTANLRVDNDDLSIFEVGLGVTADWDLQDSRGNTIKPHVSAEYRYDFIGDDVQSTSSFTAGGGSFETDGFDSQRHTVNLGTGVSYDMNDAVTVSADYGYTFKEDYDAHNLSLRAGMKF